MAGRYRSLSGALVDPEKQRRSEDSDAAPDLVLSDSQPMLGQSSSTGKPSFAYHLPRRRFSRYFTFAIASALVIFILYLVRSSRISESRVRAGLNKPPPPAPAWEQFPFLRKYHGGIRTLVDRKSNKPEYPAGSEEEELKVLQDAAMARKDKEDVVDPKDGGFQKRAGSFVDRNERFNPSTMYAPNAAESEFEQVVKCFLDNRTKLEVPGLLAYKGVTSGFPDPIMGSYELLGMRNDVCFERYGRLGPYGFGYSRKFGGSGAGMDGLREGVDEVWGDEDHQIDFRKVRWAEAQQQCVEANAHRFRPRPERRGHLFNYDQNLEGLPI